MSEYFKMLQNCNINLIKVELGKSVSSARFYYFLRKEKALTIEKGIYIIKDKYKLFKGGKIMNIAGKRIIQKVLAILVVLAMTMAQVTMVGVNLVSYAADLVKINNENVGFNVYFEDGNNSLETTSTTDNGDLKLAIDLNVKKDGYLSGGKIELDENSNFKFKLKNSNSYVSKVEDRAIYLNQINEGDTVKIEVGVEFINSDEFDVDYLNRASVISLSGTYVNSKNVERAQRIQIDGSAELKVNWKSIDETKAALNAELLTNSTYKVDDVNKRIVQLLIVSGLENNSYPVKNTSVELNIPGEPESVEVHKRSTKATNGDTEFTENNYTYSEGKLTINVENGQDGKVKWAKNANDTFVVTLTYLETENVINSKIAVNSLLTTYDDKELAQSREVVVEKEVEAMVSGDQFEDPREIAKGNLYIGKEKTYSTLTNIYVDYAKAVEGVTVEAQQPVFMTENEEKDANVEYVQTIINKEQFVKLFGATGTLEIKNQNGKTVEVVSNNSETDENGNIAVKYDNGTTGVKFITSKPEVEGLLTVENEKKILKTGYSREDIENLAKIKDISKIEYTKNNGGRETSNVSAVLNLKETETRASLAVEQGTLSTDGKEQDLRMKIVLESDSETKDLYKNPELRISLPKQINKVYAQAKLLYGNGLKLTADNFKVEKENGRQTIVIKLDGEQTNYEGEAVKGTTLMINAKVGLDKLATNSEEEIVLKYNNENATRYADKGEQKVKINVVSENPMILTNNISEYKVETVNNEGNKEVELKINDKAKNATVEMEIVNNEEAEVSNVAILGTIANESGKVERTSEVNTSVKNATVYYTTVENPTADVKDTNNGWTTKNVQDAKNYLITVDKLEDDEKVDVSYDISVAKNLGYNVSTETGYNVTYTNALTQSQKQVQATNLVLTTGAKAELKADIKAEVGGEEIKEGDEVKAGEIITYTVTLSNTGKEKAENVSLTATIPDSTTLIEYNSEYGKEPVMGTVDKEETMFNEKSEKQLTKENITLNAESKSVYTYMVKVNTDLTESKDVESKVTAKYVDKEETTTMRNKLVPGAVAVTLRTIDFNKDDTLITGYVYSYLLEIQNLTNEELKNVQVAIVKNDAINITEYAMDDEFKKVEGNELVLIIDSIPANETKEVGLRTEMKKTSTGLNQTELQIQVKDGEGKVYNSNKMEQEVKGVDIEAELKTTAKTDAENGYIHPGDEVKYQIKVKNIGTIDGDRLTIRDEFSDYLDIEDITLNGKKCDYEKSQQFEEDRAYSNITIESSSFKVGEEVTVDIDAKVYEGLSTTELLKVTNKVYAFASPSATTETEQNTLYIESVKQQSNPTDPTVDPSNPNNQSGGDNNTGGTTGGDTQTSKYIISGKVWMDTNQNGQRDSGEETVSGVKVYAIDVSTNKVVKETTTGSDGEYVLSGLDKGEYIVGFEYDTEKYMPTVYQADGVSADKNSDAVKATKNIDGIEKTLAITDSINLNKSVANIDLGLAEAKVFKLDIEKAVSKMVITNSSGTKTYDYEDTNLAKAEIKSKQLNSSTVLIEYKIKVKNTGEVAGYAKSIVDYVPSSLSFSSNLNNDWYKKGNNLYNTSLANIKIEPGETKELTLVLTKKMTESNTGLTNNKAEIEEAYSVLGDKSSGTGGSTEADTGSADILITPSTGTAVSYVALTLTIVVIIFGSAYLVNKKILAKNIKI